MGILSRFINPQNQKRETTLGAAKQFDFIFSQYWLIDDYEMSSNEKEQAYRFLVNSGGTKDSYILGLDTENNKVVKLVDVGSEPRWAPSGKQFAFTCDPLASFEKDKLNPHIEWTWSTQIYAAPACGYPIRRLSEIGEEIGGYPNSLIWTLDQRQIIFQADNKIYSLDLESSNLEFLVEGENPCLSPNEDFIVIILSIYVEETRTFKKSIRFYSLPKKEMILEIQAGQEGLTGMSLSSSGRFLAYTINTGHYGDKEGFLHVYDIEAKTDRVIYNFNGGFGAVVWSPHEDQIVLRIYPDLYLINTDGSGLTRLTNGFTDHPRVLVISNYPSWRKSLQ